MHSKLILIMLFIFMFRINTCSQTKSIEFSPYSDRIEISNAGVSLVYSAFDYVNNELDFIDFDDCNNCNSRAHLIAAILESRYPELNMAKVWLFADFKRTSQKEKYRYKKYVYLSAGEECSSWGYHVAPVVLIKNKNSVDTLVFDPSIQNNPVSLQKWAIDLTSKEGKTYLIIKDKKYYTYPDNSNKKFEDMKTEWADDVKSVNDDDYSKSIGKILKSKHGLIEHWLFKSEEKMIRDLLSIDEEEN